MSTDLLTAYEAARTLRFDVNPTTGEPVEMKLAIHNFRRFVKRQGIKHLRRGRVLLFRRSDLERAIEPKVA